MYNMKKGGGGGSGTYPLLKTNNFGKIHDNASQFKDNLPNIYVTWLNQQLSEIMFIRPLNLLMSARNHAKIDKNHLFSNGRRFWTQIEAWLN